MHAAANAIQDVTSIGHIEVSLKRAKPLSCMAV